MLPIKLRHNLFLSIGFFFDFSISKWSLLHLFKYRFLAHHIILVHTHKKEAALNKLFMVLLDLLQIQMSTLLRHLHFHAYCSVVHNSQGTEATWTPIDRCMDKEDVVGEQWKKKGIMPFVTRMDHEGIVLSEISQTEKTNSVWSLSSTISQNLLKFMSIKLVRPSKHLILCLPLLLLPSVFPSIRIFSNESALRIRRPTY